MSAILSGKHRLKRLRGSHVFGSVYVALVHYPVYNKAGDVITAAVSNLDLHDISRAAKTYGVRAFYVVTPLTDQQELVRRIVAHWITGLGATYNPDRREALELVTLVSSYKEAVADITEKENMGPLKMVTDARPQAGNIAFDSVPDILDSQQPLLLTFGTAWGLTKEFIQRADCTLAPIMGPTHYNHLSVRSAAAVVLDRLLGVD
jgi:hypothetical protein